MEENEYIFGTEQQETERLELQHHAWQRYAHDLWELGGVCEGQCVLDLGCGPGYTTFELAERVGPSGRVIGSEISERFVRYLEEEKVRRGLDHIDVRLGSVEELALEDGQLDVVYVRWLLSWLPDPKAVLAKVARAVRPGGVLLLQEYLDWHCLRLMPHSDAFTAAREACRRSWPGSGATIDIGQQLPQIARELGLEVERFAPIARIGRPGSQEWKWVGSFFRSYLPKLVDRGFLAREDLDRVFAEWPRWEEQADVFLFTPVMVDTILRVPAVS